MCTTHGSNILFCLHMERVLHGSSSRVSTVPSRHRRASSPGEQAVGGLFFDSEAIRDGVVPAQAWSKERSPCAIATTLLDVEGTRNSAERLKKILMLYRLAQAMPRHGPKPIRRSDRYMANRARPASRRKASWTRAGCIATMLLSLWL